MSNESGQENQSFANGENATRNGHIEESGNVDRIRDILFGSQMRDYDGRFQRLEERLVREAGELRSDVQKRLETLEGFIKSETESMLNRLKNEQAERGHAVERLVRDLAETARSFEMKLGMLDDQTGRDLRDLRQQLLEQSKALTADIKDKHEQIKAGLNSEAQQIRGAMTGRESLAEMFNEVALRLKGEFRVPGAS